MPQCPECQAPHEAGDRFCGECGCTLASVAAPPDEPQEAAPDKPQEPTPAEPSTPGKNILFIGGTIMAVGLVALVGKYFSDLNEQRRYEQIAAAAEGPSPWSSAGVRSEPSGSSTDREQNSPNGAADSMGDFTLQGQSTMPPINAGQWEFNWQINNVTGTRRMEPDSPYDTFPIGRTGTESRCISPAMADAPQNIAFPMNPEANCRALEYSMSGGRIDSSFSCQLPSSSEPIDAAISGTYDANSVDVILRMRIPAELIATGSYVDEMVDVFYGYRGYRSSAC